VIAGGAFVICGAMGGFGVGFRLLLFSIFFCLVDFF
jgi:hypothetical protein